MWTYFSFTFTFNFIFFSPIKPSSLQLKSFLFLYSLPKCPRNFSSNESNSSREKLLNSSPSDREREISQRVISSCNFILSLFYFLQDLSLSSSKSSVFIFILSRRRISVLHVLYTYFFSIFVSFVIYFYSFFEFLLSNHSPFWPLSDFVVYFRPVSFLRISKNYSSFPDISYSLLHLVSVSLISLIRDISPHAAR